MYDPIPETPPRCVHRPTCSCTQRTGCPLGHPFFGPDPSSREFIEHFEPATQPRAMTTIDVTDKPSPTGSGEFDEASTVAAPSNQLTTVVVDLE